MLALRIAFIPAEYLLLLECGSLLGFMRPFRVAVKKCSKIAVHESR